MGVLLEGHWLSLFDCSKNSWIIPKLSVFCSSRETLHPEVRNESRLPEWVFCCHLEESLVDSIQNWGSLCLHVSLYSHPLKRSGSFQPRQTFRHVIVRCCTTIHYAQISLGSPDSCKWEGHVFSCGQLYFVWEEETNCILLCGREKFSKFISSLLSPGLFPLNIFYICHAKGPMLRKSSVLKRSQCNKVICQAVGQMTQSSDQSLFQESERTVINI